MQTGLWPDASRAEYGGPMKRTRLPPLPELDWKPDGTPLARGMDDIYFSVEDGLSETREIFLKTCGLPDRWAGRDVFTIAELGFGTGLNFLASWDLWRRNRPGPTARLHFVSFEGFPLMREQAARALSKWPELSALSDELLARWPSRTRGIRRIAYSDGIVLTLHIDPVETALPRSRFQADAWFLDGFAPAKNSDMWADHLYPEIALRSAPGAHLGTYTVAGAVRRGLAEAGFEVAKAPGHGRKRERLVARIDTPPTPPADPFGWMRPPPDRPGRIAVIGAGIAGTCLAAACQRRGADVTVFDAAGEAGQGASGNPLALVMPRLDAEDTVPARVLVDAYLHAQTAFAGLPGTAQATARQTARDDREQERFDKVLSDPPLEGTELGTAPEGGLLHGGALIIRPQSLLLALLGAASLRFGRSVDIEFERRTVNGELFDVILLANGAALGACPETAWLPIEGRLGQVEYATADKVPPSAVASGHYALASGTDRLWGATFEAAPEGVPTVSNAARDKNLAALRALVGEDWVDPAQSVSRAGIRATTPDRLPLAGPVPRFDAACAQYADVRSGRAPAGEPPVYEGVYMLGGLGSRGFTFAPWLAEGLVSHLFAEPSPFAGPAAEAVSPLRFLFRGLKRGQF